MVKNFLKAGLLAAAVFLSVTPAMSQSSDSKGASEEVKKTIDDVVKVNQNYPGDENQKMRREKLREVIQPRFDFSEMSKRSLGTNWLEITPEEQSEFISVFSDLLAYTYLNRVETVKSDMVKIAGENLDFPKSMVKTMVDSNGDRFPIDYKLMNQNGKWRVYDVVIENIGLVANYRNEFAGIIRKDKFSGLMERLKDKVNKIKQ